MRKLFLLSLALMATITLWAADPTIDVSFGTTTAEEDDTKAYQAAVKEYTTEGITLKTYGSTGGTENTQMSGNIGGSYYVGLGGGATQYDIYSFVISAPGKLLDSVAVFWATNNGNNKSDNHNLAVIGWEDDSAKGNGVDFYTTTAHINKKKTEGGSWQTIDLSGVDLEAVSIARQFKTSFTKNKEGGASLGSIGDNKTINVMGVKVWLKESKTPVDTTATLTAVKVNDVAISASDFATLLEDPFKVDLSDSYTTAPTMKFARQTVITYDDSSTKVTDDTITVAATEVSSKWQAQATINSTTYTVTAVIPSTYKVAYYDGASKLGDELVEVGEHPTAAGVDTDKEFYSFQAWQKDAVDIALTAVEGAAGDSITLVARYTKVYSQSINIEQTVLDYGTGYDIETAFATKGISYVDIDALDTLNDLEKKDNRNYAFLGLKVKKSTSKISVLLAAGSTLRVKFGNVGAKITVKVGNADPVDKTADDLKTPYEYTNDTEGDIIVRFNSTGTKTVVFKQIMIDDAIEDVVLPAPGAYAITLAETTNGSITASWEGKTKEKVNVPVSATVTLTLTPDDGYKVASVKYNDGTDHVIEPVNQAYSFTMPEAAVTVTAVFSQATALDNTEAGVKAVKRLENGMLVIEKNGVRYNAQGQIIH